MARSELAALVNSRYTDIELVDALNHQSTPAQLRASTHGIFSI